MPSKSITPPTACHLAAAGLLMLAVAACSTAPAEPLADPVPPPRRPYDAKTQLETGVYGSPPPARPRY